MHFCGELDPRARTLEAAERAAPPISLPSGAGTRPTLPFLLTPQHSTDTTRAALSGAGELARAMAIAASGLDEPPDSPAPCAPSWPVGAVRLPCSAGARCRTVLCHRHRAR